MQTLLSPSSPATLRHDSRHGASAYAWTYSHVLYPTWQKLAHGRPIADQLQLLERSQWRSHEEIAAEQLGSLRSLLLFAATEVPYYRELFAKARFDPLAVESIADLSQLPVLTREIISERYDDLVVPARRATNIRKGTSGTSGRPLVFEYGEESESWRQAVRLRGYGWAGYRIGMPTLHYWAQGATVPKGLGAAKIWVDRALRREMYVDAVAQDAASLLHAVHVLRWLKPHLIVGYTQATAVLARFILDRGLRDWADIPVICAAEAVLAHDRAAIETAFGPHVFETYGARETMLIAAECSAHEGMHLSEENLVVEVTRDGKPAAPGETGEVVVTDLHNFGMPMIRYVNGDLAALSPPTRCICGRGLARLERVDGRWLDTLHDPSGAPIPGVAVIALFSSAHDLVRQFQIVQRSNGAVTLRAVPGREWDNAAFASTVERLRGYLRGQPLAVELAEYIGPGKSGKRRPIVVEPKPS